VRLAPISGTKRDLALRLESARYDLVHAKAGINGEDIARPAEFLIDKTGTVKWVNLTENYWVRATPEQVLEVASRVDNK